MTTFQGHLVDLAYVQIGDIGQFLQGTCQVQDKRSPNAFGPAGLFCVPNSIDRALVDNGDFFHTDSRLLPGNEWSGRWLCPGG